jgi:hypothetical protein
MCTLERKGHLLLKKIKVCNANICHIYPILHFIMYFRLVILKLAFIMLDSVMTNPDFSPYRLDNHDQTITTASYLDGFHCLLQILFQVFFNTRRRSSACISVDHIALTINQKLGKVPFDSIEQKARCFFLQICPQGMGIATIYINLLEQSKCNSSLPGKFFNVCFSTWFLPAKLITRECQDFQSFVMVFCVQFLQFLVIFGGESSGTCNVDNKDNLSGILPHRDWVAINIDGRKVIKVGHVLTFVFWLKIFLVKKISLIVKVYFQVSSVGF